MIESFDTCDALSSGPSSLSALKDVCFGVAKGILFLVCPVNFVECLIGKVIKWIVLKS